MPGAPVNVVHVSGWDLDLVLGAMLEVYPSDRFLKVFLNGFADLWPFDGTKHVGEVKVEEDEGLEDAGST